MTLHAALGDVAWAIMPRSFSLPDELPQLRTHIAGLCEAPRSSGTGSADAAEGSGPGSNMWMLKTAQHLGKGLKRQLDGECMYE